jgi:hypothetical protein
MRPALIRHQLFFGPYYSTGFKVGALVKDAIRDKVRIAAAVCCSAWFGKRSQRSFDFDVPVR